MKGTRRDDVEPPLFRCGDYGRWRGSWFCHPPPNKAGESFLGNLNGHQITEHEHGTITVSPSILVSVGKAERQAWHGYLERGIWREC
jgi:hypothetical protein